MIRRVIALLEKEIENKKEQIVNGFMSDYLQYRCHVSALRAFEEAVQIAKTVESSSDEEGD